MIRIEFLKCLDVVAVSVYEFPFNKVKRDSRIIIYGAGTVGQEYLHQVTLTQYCKIVCMVDKNFERYQGLSCTVTCINELSSLTYDMIVIANESSTVANTIRDLLINEYNVDIEKIVYEKHYVQPTPVVSDVENFLSEDELAFSKLEKYPIAVNLNGGIGDYIVRKKNIVELASWDSSVLIDIYVNQGSCEFAKNLFSDVLNINKIIDTNSQYYALKFKYLAAFYFDVMLRIDFLNEKVFCAIPLTLRKKLEEVHKSCLEYGLESGGLLYAIHYARCEKDGLNCYTSYNRYGAFHVDGYKVAIPLLTEFQDRFQKLNLGCYITLNYGWDKSSGHLEPSAKVWPLKYFSELAKLIKEKFPNVNVIQIGTENSEKIDRCDRYILGEDIETVKYVLKNSLLHIDSEGGLVHIATQFDTKCIVMFGPTPSAYYGYNTNMNLVSSKCNNCYWFVTDCISCYKKMDQPECMYSISPSMVMDKVKEVLNKRLEK